MPGNILSFLAMTERKGQQDDVKKKLNANAPKKLHLHSLANKQILV